MEAFSSFGVKNQNYKPTNHGERNGIFQFVDHIIVLTDIQFSQQIKWERPNLCWKEQSECFGADCGLCWSEFYAMIYLTLLAEFSRMDIFPLSG